MASPHPTVCPETLFSVANQFAMVIGEGPAEAQTWRTAPFEKDGAKYATYNLLLSQRVLEKATQPLERPEWDEGEIIDMDAAATCQQSIDFVDVSTLQEGDSFPQPSPDRILVLINHGNINSAVQSWGLKLVRPININTATKDALRSLNGVDAVRAQAIIDGRPWSSVDDLATIQGISADMIAGWNIEV